jgi:hypothetical protein
VPSFIRRKMSCSAAGTNFALVPYIWSMMSYGMLLSSMQMGREFSSACAIELTATVEKVLDTKELAK